jgi:hypothetical protein
MMNKTRHRAKKRETKGANMKPEIIKGQWRIVYDGHFDWVRRAGLAGKLASDLVFSSWADAMSYLDKCAS